MFIFFYYGDVANLMDLLVVPAEEEEKEERAEPARLDGFNLRRSYHELRPFTASSTSSSPILTGLPENRGWRKGAASDLDKVSWNKNNTQLICIRKSKSR